MFNKLVKIRDKLTEYNQKKQDQDRQKHEHNAKQAAKNEVVYKKELKYRQTIQRSRETKQKLNKARYDTPITHLEKLSRFGIQTAKGATAIIVKAAKYNATTQRPARKQTHSKKKKKISRWF